MATIAAYAFDAYGTVFDVYGVAAACEGLFPGRGAELVRLWRQKQLEYTWLRTLMGRYADFWQVTGDALDAAAAALGLPLDGTTRETLLAQYLRLPAYPDVPGALARLAGRPRVIFSNGTPAMLAAAVEAAGLTGLVDAIISVDAAGCYKPDPRAYALVPARLGVPPAQIALVSSNFWDVAGARAYGLQAVWVNRSGTAPDRLGQDPTWVVTSLSQVPLA